MWKDSFLSYIASLALCCYVAFRSDLSAFGLSCLIKIHTWARGVAVRRALDAATVVSA